MHRRILYTFNLRYSQIRSYKTQNVRVRFAPSPTGHLHLGGLRTALYNYLFARANNGSFILRIEDTDQSRIQPESMEKLQDDLVWAGIIPDEDPVRGGPAGPYVQSKRLELYREESKKLLNAESAYFCFCTERRLDMLRREALKARQIPKYDNRCRHLSRQEVKEKLNRGDKYCLRFKLSPDPQPFNDLIYGEICCASGNESEGDPVIVKSDGFPTYHFANVVDDHFMEITHVLRGVEWQISTPKHIQLYKAFGWEVPAYAHLPLILNADGSKLSKRQNDIRVETYRNEGIFPMALLNFITHAGGGFDRKQDENRSYTYEELIKQFNIKRINKNSSKLAPEKLLEFNRYEIGKLLENEDNENFLIERVGRLVEQAFPDRVNDGSLQLDNEHVMSTLKWAQNRINKLDDLVKRDLAFLWVIPSSLTSLQKNDKYFDAISLVCEKLLNIDNYEEDTVKKCLREIATNREMEFAIFMKLLRQIISGLEEGPAVVEMMTILGRDRTIDRLKRAL